MLENINSENKVSILLSGLEERYKSIHIIRDRVQNIGIWFLGIMFGVGGWIIQSNINLCCLQKGLYLFGVITFFIMVRFVYLEDLQKGFKGQQKIAAKIEQSLGFFDPKYFNENESSLYPKEWLNSGKENCDGKFIGTTVTLLYTGVIFLIITILFFA